MSKEDKNGSSKGGGKHRKDDSLPHRRDQKNPVIPSDPARPVETGSNRETSCFGCGNWPCTCTKIT